MFPVDDVVEAEAIQILDFVSAHSQDPNFTTSPEQEVVVNPKVMLSTEIAALMGKLYKDVMRDIRVITEQLQSANLRFACKSVSYTGSNGQQYKCYELDKEATMVVVTGYDVAARMKVIKRWQELEKIAKCEQQSHFEPKEEPEAIDWLSPDVLNRFALVSGLIKNSRANRELKSLLFRML